MNKEPEGINLDHIYNLRKKFTVVGLTGKTGSGCSEVSNQLIKGFGDGEDYTNPLEIFKFFHGLNLRNAYRKHRIVYNYAKVNFKQYVQIKYKDIVTLLLVQNSLDDLSNYLESNDCKKEFLKSKIPEPNFNNEIEAVKSLINPFNEYSNRLIKIRIDEIKDNGNWQLLYDLFFGESFQKFSNDLHEALGKRDINRAFNYHKLIQIFCNNLRKSGSPFNSSYPNSDKIFTIAFIINYVIKSHRESNDSTQVVINSLKNPMEIMFFKQRYSAFYSIAVNKENDVLELHLNSKFGGIDEELISSLIDEEYNGVDDKEFHKQKVADCLQLADIHISLLSPGEAQDKNLELFNKESIDKASSLNQTRKKQRKDIKTSPFFSWQDQLLRYVSLIDHPGLITPSPEERCMQLAYTAKHNSGCISRQVGAAITDEDYSVKAIGWNNTPSGQVPCSLRNADDLIKYSHDVNAFTPYERKDKLFRKVFEDNFDKKVQQKGDLLNGRNVCFCFKSLKNSISEGKNQVHTRSLHAEENAFLQLAKYGSGGIENGILFSTASPCELCSKKAYQLGINLIYYIDPYPGISKPHILSAGEKPIETRLFTGAIGSAYYRIYQPFMPYKDEMSLLLGQKIKDKTSKLETENSNLKERIKELEKEINKKEK